MPSRIDQKTVYILGTIVLTALIVVGGIIGAIAYNNHLESERIQQQQVTSVKQKLDQQLKLEACLKIAKWNYENNPEELKKAESVCFATQ